MNDREFSAFTIYLYSKAHTSWRCIIYHGVEFKTRIFIKISMLLGWYLGPTVDNVTTYVLDLSFFYKYLTH